PTRSPAAPRLHPLSLHDALPISADAYLARKRSNASPLSGSKLTSSRRPPALRVVFVGKVKAMPPLMRHGPLVSKRFAGAGESFRSEEHTSELQSPDLVCRLLLEK